MSSSKHKDKTIFTNKQKQDIVIHRSKHPSITNVELVDWVKKEFKLDVHPSTIGRLLKNKNEIENNPTTKRQRTVQYPELENALLEWVLQNQERVILKQVKKHEEDVSVDDAIVAAAIPHLEPDTTLATKCLKGKKKDLERLTLALCANANAEKDKKMNVLGAIRFIVQAWREVIPETIHNCFRYIGILPDAQNNEESFIDDNDNELMDELYTDIKPLNFPNIMDLEKYIDYPGEKDTNEVLTLNAVEILEHYIVQNDFSETAQLKYNEALLKLQKEIRKLQIKAFKQTSIKTYFELVD
ncbi:23416_t:CDS:2 [Gigaspora margarita]|uniref:23416_t:CDS:1 n=1 Tax=Gigaspora margarita TaxID=4874 RepID=A0ABN7VED6_GIGMA|nr:23416_t:CDS:2 [Gigaspora margarita]